MKLLPAIFVLFAGISAYCQRPLLLLVPILLLLTIPVTRRPSLLFFALIFSLPVSVEIMVTSSIGTDLPSEFLMMGLTTIFIITFLQIGRILPVHFYQNPLIFLLIMHLCWIVVACIYAEDKILSAKFLLAKIWFVIPFVVLPQVFIKSKSSWKILSLSLVIPMSWVVIQAIYRHASYDFSFENINKTLSPYFRNHVNYGAMLACTLPVLFVLHRKAESVFQKTSVRILLVIFFSGLVLSFSRGAWLGLAVALPMMLAVIKRKVQWLLLAGLLAIIAIFLWLGTNNRYLNFRPDFQQTIFHTDFKDHMRATYQFRDVSTAERFYRWIAAVRMGGEYPLTGVGPNNFYKEYKPYTVQAYRTWVSANRDHSTAHNYFLLTMAEQGVPGLIFFTTLLFGMFLYAQNLYHKIPGRFYRHILLAIISILSIITTVNFLSDLIETDKIGSLFFLCLGLLVKIDSLEKDHKL